MHKVCQAGSRLFCAALAAGLLAYTLIRAVGLGFTHDESFSYLHWVLAPLGDVLSYRGPSPSNHHLLSSLLMRASAALWGPAELALRLPSWLGHLLYLLGAYLLARRLRRPLLAAGAFAAMAANPFLLDFFSVARGYGLALGLTLLGLHVWLELLRAPRVRTALLAFGLLGLAVLASFSFLTLYLAAAALGAGLVWREKRPVAVILGCSGLLLAAVLPLLFKLKDLGELYYGGTRGFVVDTVQSLVLFSFYDQSYGELLALPLAWVAVALFAGSVLLLWKDVLGPVALLLLLVVLGLRLQHLLFDTRFLLGRSALFFVPLFFFVLYAAMDRAGKWMQGVGVVLALALLAFTATQMNLTHTLTWSYDADTRAMVEDLERIPGVRSVDVPWAVEPAVRFYLTTRHAHGPLQGLQVRTDGGGDALYRPLEAAPWLHGVPAAPVAVYRVSRNVLAVRARN